MDQNSNKIKNNSDQFIKEDEIDLLETFKSLYRNKTIVFIFCFVSLIFSTIKVLNTRRTYQGEFQIVLAKEKSLLQTNVNRPELAALNIGLRLNSNQLRTEVGILKSPSVLMDIFNYVKKEKVVRNDESYQNMRFKSWREDSLDIELKKGTSILNLAYKDQDKDLILPVLNKISAAYQSYSGEKRLREIELDTAFLNNQIFIYKNKIKESQQEMELFGNKYNLSIIKSTGNDKASTSPIINVEAIKDKIYKLDNQLALLRSIYSESDKNIQNLINKKNAFIASAERPKGVVIKYRQLINEVERDKRTLLELENNLRLMSLEEARDKDPWRLLTKPTLLPNPVAPKRTRFVFFGGIIGLLIGSVVALRYEKSKGIVFSAIEIRSLANFPIIAELIIKNDSWNESLYLIIKNLISQTNEKIGLLINKEIDDSLVKKIERNLEELTNSKKLLLTSDIKKIDQCDKSVYLTSLGATSKNSIINFKNRILFNEKKVLGFIVLNNL